MATSLLVEVLTYPHLRHDLSQVFLALFTHVTNASAIRSRIIAAATADGPKGDEERELINFAFIDAKTIVSREHLLSAVNVALVAASHDSMTTKTVHSEILWALNYSNNISESIKRFGVGSSSGSLIVVRIGDINSFKPTGPRLSPSDITTMMTTAVQGQLTPLREISQETDMSLIKKYYKLNSEPAILRFNAKGLKGTQPNAFLDEERRIIDEIVTSSVAMKTVLA
ncbi:hypothetical protein FRB96_003833 [Tulasnella sp. 330]|nr:hypothetical protein FRB96_003833 [Tulasnella sp. 330]